jgi:hypothetical protein
MYSMMVLAAAIPVYIINNALLATTLFNEKNMKQNQKKFTKRNKIFPLTKPNEISLFFIVSRNKQNFAKQFFVSLCFMFRETKKGCKMETLQYPDEECGSGGAILFFIVEHITRD